MTATEFKSELKRIENKLKGSTLCLTIVTDNGQETLNFTDLHEFGLKILELEKLGAGFSFSSVSNHLVTKGIHRGKKTNLDYWLRYGVWDQFNITASTVGKTVEVVEPIQEPTQKDSFRTRVFKRAYHIQESTGKTFAVCLSKAWALYRLTKQMINSEQVAFAYEKKNGSLRRAYGTLKNVSQFIKGTGSKTSSVFKYWDLDVAAFRCFRAENLVTVYQ